MIPTRDELEKCLLDAKLEAVRMSKDCGMYLDQYGDEKLLFPGNNEIIARAVEKDDEADFAIENVGNSTLQNNMSEEAVTEINDDISRIALVKKTSSKLPQYVQAKNFSRGRQYSYFSKQKNILKTPFVQYEGVYIRKSTTLYLLQENAKLSNDRLLRVRDAQLSHLYRPS